MAPGSSLGGARPKASIIDNDGGLWIAKFPSRTVGPIASITNLPLKDFQTPLAKHLFQSLSESMISY